MASTKVCPYCFEEIKHQAIRCKHCHADLTTESDKGATYGGKGGVTIGGSSHRIEGGIHIITSLGELDRIEDQVKRQLKNIYEQHIRG